VGEVLCGNAFSAKALASAFVEGAAVTDEADDPADDEGWLQPETLATSHPRQEPRKSR
jgi:hypothetical protein